MPDDVVFPNSQIGFIIGPQLVHGSSLNPFQFFDATQLERGIVHADSFPKIPPLPLTGTVSVTQGQSIVLGTGTKFTTEVDPQGPAPMFNGPLQVEESDGVFRDCRVAKVRSDTELELTAPYEFLSVNQRPATTYCHVENIGYNTDVYLNTNYYDLALCLYALYYRTGDVAYRDYARKVADSWWRSAGILEGKAAVEFSHAPRNCSIGGLMLRALDGRPEMWDWLVSYTRYVFDIWIKRYIGTSEGLVNGVRDSSYCMVYATWLSQVLPDANNGAALRAEFLADAENAAVNYFGHYQYEDGSYRWDDPYYVDADGGTLVGVMQPFMVGLLLNALIDVFRATVKPEVKENIKQQVTKCCEHLYVEGPYRGNTPVGIPGYNWNWRCFHYFYHGGTTVNPTKYEHGDGATATAAWEISSARQLSATVFDAYGFAYQVSGNPSFKTWGDEIYEACFGDVIDGLHNEVTGAAKNYNQNYRMGGRYLPWSSESGPEPGPSPEPEVMTVSWPKGESKQSSIADQMWVQKYILLKNRRGNMADFLLVKGSSTGHYRKVVWPGQESNQDAVLASQWHDRYRFRRHLPGAYAEFELVGLE